MSEPVTSQLYYGPPGGGKTNLIASAIWDFERKKQIRNGVIMAFGREDSTLRGLPESLRGTCVQRFAAPSLVDLTWFNQLDKYTRFLLSEAHKGNKLEILGFDGFSEFDLLYESCVADPDDKDKFAKFDKLMVDTFAVFQRLDPVELGCHVLATARIMDKRKAKEARRSGGKIEGDPEWVNAEHYPAYRGKFRYELGYYFDFCFYMEEELKDVGKPPVHVLNTIRTGNFLIKNALQREWLTLNLPWEIEEPTFDGLLDFIKRAKSAQEADSA